MIKAHLAIILIPAVIFAIISGCIGSDDNDESVQRSYEVDINRNYNNESELELIELTENITPPDGLWWGDEFDNIKIADCVNRDAIEYYSDLVGKIKKDHTYTGIDIKKINFTYGADVIHIKNNNTYNTSDEDLIEVNLTIHFYEYCGNLCAMGFEHYRSAVFDHDLNLISVRGDDVQSPLIVS